MYIYIYVSKISHVYMRVYIYIYLCGFPVWGFLFSVLDVSTYTQRKTTCTLMRFKEIVGDEQVWGPRLIKVTK